MTVSSELLFRVVSDPRSLAGFDAPQWNRLLRTARRTGLLPRLGVLTTSSVDAACLPPGVQPQFLAAETACGYHERCVRREVMLLQRSLSGFDDKVVLLKGAAYLMADLPVARGRLMSDLDILVPRSGLAAVEAALRDDGWEPLSHDEYDDHYYREWMHELPPLRQRERGTVIDVHHTILPLSGRLRPAPELLLEAALPIPGCNFWRLSPVDMLLHSAAHMFQDGDLAGGLRDLLDLDMLFRYFGEHDDGFWQNLVPRARELQLLRPLYYALRQAASLLGTPVPSLIESQIGEAGPAWWTRMTMNWLLRRGLEPQDGDGESWDVSLARLLLYVRGHWLRMPPGLLLKHLAHKAAKRWKTKRGSS